jgi:hypothetical protein
MKKNLIISPVIVHDNCDNINILNKNTSIQPDYDSFYSVPGGFVSLDPRTYDTTRNCYIQYDRPPLHSVGTSPQFPMNKISTNQTGFYDNYQSINGGNIRYYTDLSTEDPFKDMIFTIPCYNEPQLLIDPMGSIKPYYNRIPIFENNNLKDNSFFDYSFLKDTSEFREDLIARRNNTININEFGAYQLVNNPSVYYPTFQNSPHFPLNTNFN